MIALIGNPNTGKTSLFNALTGQKQRVGNYSGVTVEKKYGLWKLDSTTPVSIIDLPGTYSLSAQTIDERIAVDVLSGYLKDTQPDLIIVVVDAENLQRNLYLASQAAELNLPMIIALNCWDVVEKKGIQIDSKLLEKRLGIPVIPTIANQSKGILDLAHSTKEALKTKPRMVRPKWPEPVQNAIKSLNQTFCELSNGEIQRLLFDNSSALIERLEGDSHENELKIQKAKERKYRQGACRIPYD